jgi:hypothetical protein
VGSSQGIALVIGLELQLMNFPQTSSKEKLSSGERDLEGKYDSVKGSAKDTLTRARDSTENAYNEARTVSGQIADDAEKKVAQATNGWSSWFNWGKSKADDIESEAEQLGSKGAQTAANTAENVKGKHA